jgi:RimJ/RimL family protein N-acetyltransferase
MSAINVRTLDEGDERALEAFLAPRLTFSIFLVSNMRRMGLVDRGERYQGTYIAAFKGADIVGVAAHYWNGMLILQAPAYLEEIISTALSLSGRPLQGLIGIDEHVQRAKENLGLVQADYQIDEADGLYSLDLANLIVPSQLEAGQVQGRRLEPGDIDLVTEWRVAYLVEFLDALENSDLWERSRASMEEKCRTGESWVLEVNGEIVSNTSFNAGTKEVVQVGGVYTPGELRGRGYGRAVVAVSLLDAGNEGAEKAVLFTGDGNLAARKAYAALGFKRIGDYRLSILRDPVD